LARLEVSLLERAKGRLGEVVLDPSQWPSIMEDISASARTTGAALLQSDVRTPDVPMTGSVTDYFRSYFENDLHIADIRAVKGVPLLLAGRCAIRDQDLFSSESAMLRDPLYEHGASFGFRWWSAIGFRSGSALWGLALQRTIHEGMFEDDEMHALASLSECLTNVATLSRAVGRQALLGSLSALELINEPALSISVTGRVIEMNRGAADLFDADFRVVNKRLYIRDAKAQQVLEHALWARPRDDEIRLRASGRAGNVIVVRRETKHPIFMRVLPVHAAASTPFVGARVILVLRDIEAERRAPLKVLSEAFSLTVAEAKVASMIAAGLSPEEIAGELQVSRETIRNQLKAIFSKTKTRRQNELAFLITRMST
jgi:DNA-binding CsgD family transcriptional regulator/PAS domain-containing protein